MAKVGAPLQIDAIARTGYIIALVNADPGISYTYSGSLVKDTVHLNMPNIDSTSTMRCMMALGMGKV